MILLFYAGWLLMLVAFAAASAETIVGGTGFIFSAHDLWYAISAKHFTISQIRIERLSLSLWNPVLTTVLMAPAWFLFGAPGVALAWCCRPGRVLSAEEKEDHRKHAEGLFLLDELAKEAKRNDYIYNANDDDRAPDHSGHEALAALDGFPVLTDEEMQREIDSVFADESVSEAHSNEPASENASLAPVLKDKLE